MRQPKPPRDPNSRRYLIGAAAFVAVVLCGVVWCWFLYSDAKHRLRAIQDDRDALEAKLVGDRKEAKLYKALDDWDNVVWLDELYDLTARIPDSTPCASRS